MNLQVTRWIVDYGSGRVKEIRVPHAWRQDVDVRWEGPVSYRTLIDVPIKPSKMRFWGVSYACEIIINGKRVHNHKGIWDAFDVSLADYRGKRVEIEVKVTKNGCETYPVKSTLAGFLPYVFNTFGGIFRPVEIVEESEPLSQPAGETVPLPHSVRGILHWGWYPDLGHCHPSPETIDSELDYVQSLGFNMVKFCLWLPPHNYLTAMHERGMVAWLELPLWLPSSGVFDSQSVDNELEAVVRQYGHHENIVAWTLGCELENAPAEYREKWVKKITALTRCPLVKDNSGGAEMYGGDPREFGTFYDYHPYAEAHQFLPLLESLRNGPRAGLPILLGETVDHDVHRDLEQIAETMPFWASALGELNDQGVRWQYDMPKFLATNRFAHEAEPSGHKKLMQQSVQKALFVRQHVVEQIRGCADIQGYVLTGLRDTPISSSGIQTDWGRKRYTPDQFESWNAESVLFLIPRRDPRWTRGGNRVAYADLYNFFEHQPALINVGFAGPATGASAIWKLATDTGKVLFEGTGEFQETAGHPSGVATIFFQDLDAGNYVLECEFGTARSEWRIFVHTPASFDDCSLHWTDDRFKGIKFGSEGIPIVPGWRECVRSRVGERMVVLIDGEGGLPAPYWRECITQGFMMSWQERLAVCPDQVIDANWLELLGDAKWLETRIDTRTYEETPYIARIGDTILTTYRPQGGHGTQPNGLFASPSGQSLLRRLVDISEF